MSRIFAIAQNTFREAVRNKILYALLVFGKGADRAFTAWYLARYVDEIAAAGQSVLNLPMYVNAALGGAFTDTGSGNGGPDWPVMDIWKAGAPHLAMQARIRAAAESLGKESSGIVAFVADRDRRESEADIFLGGIFLEKNGDKCRGIDNDHPGIPDSSYRKSWLRAASGPGVAFPLASL